MVTVWISVSIFLGIIWFFGSVITLYYIFDDADDSYIENPKTGEATLKFTIQLWAACVFLSFIFAVAWPVVLILSVPLLLVYGAVQAIRLAIIRPWKKPLPNTE